MTVSLDTRFRDRCCTWGSFSESSESRLTNFLNHQSLGPFSKLKKSATVRIFFYNTNNKLPHHSTGHWETLLQSRRDSLLRIPPPSGSYLCPVSPQFPSSHDNLKVNSDCVYELNIADSYLFIYQLFFWEQKNPWKPDLLSVSSLSLLKQHFLMQHYHMF